jgi:hypothetical protein
MLTLFMVAPRPARIGAGARCDAGVSGKCCNALRRAGPPHQRPQSLARSRRRGRLVVTHTPVPPAPSEWVRDCSQMGDHHRDLVLGAALSFELTGRCRVETLRATDAIGRGQMPEPELNCEAKPMVFT